VWHDACIGSALAKPDITGSQGGDPVMKIDRVQRQLLSELQLNARVSNQELADRVGLSVSPCWRRVRDLETSGLIKRYVAVLDRRKLGLGTCVLVNLQLKTHDARVTDQVERHIHSRREIVECYALSGDSDYMLKVFLPDVESYAMFMHNFLLKLPEVATVRSVVALREVKHDTALPI
jgi:Lrp/AsnC family transcriptional regulator, leucine-responsive regulatory protein